MQFLSLFLCVFTLLYIIELSSLEVILTDTTQTLQRVTQCLGDRHQARLTDGYQFDKKYAIGYVRLECYQPNSPLKPLKGKPVNTCMLLYIKRFSN